MILKIKKSQCPPSFSAKSSPCSAHPRFDFLNWPAYSAVELSEAFADTRDECDLAGYLVKRDVGSKRFEHRLNGISRAHEVNVNSAQIAYDDAPPGRLQTILEERFYAAWCGSWIAG